MNLRPFLRLEPAVRLPTCPSTQDVCRRLAVEGAPEGTTVIADEQTSGRGREHRTWHSSAGAGLYASFLLRPRVDPSHWLAFTPLIALALAEALEALRASTVSGPGSQRFMIKWPNDVLGGRGKVAGILAETVEGSIIVGLGLNLSQRRGEFPPEIRNRASSLRLEGFDPVPGRDAVLRAFDHTLGRAYRSFQEGDSEFLRRGLLDRFYLEGRRLRIRGCGPTEIAGVARSLGESGELLLETADGPRRVFSGEVVWIGPPVP